MSFYQKLYTTKNLQNSNNIFLESENIPTLADELKEQCDLPLSIEECGVALSKLQNNKSPGSDGLTTNFINFSEKT